MAIFLGEPVGIKASVRRKGWPMSSALPVLKERTFARALQRVSSGGSPRRGCQRSPSAKGVQNWAPYEMTLLFMKGVLSTVL